MKISRSLSFADMGLTGEGSATRCFGGPGSNQDDDSIFRRIQELLRPGVFLPPGNTPVEVIQGAAGSEGACTQYRIIIAAC